MGWDGRWFESRLSRGSFRSSIGSRVEMGMLGAQCSVQMEIAGDRSTRSGKKKIVMRSTPSLRSFPGVAFETVGLKKKKKKSLFALRKHKI